MMNSALASRRLAPLASALLAVGLMTVWAGARPGPAFAEACAGSGSGPCPYASARIIGQRAEGVLRFPEAVALDASGNVYVADQLTYVVQKFTAAGVFETEWGSYGGGQGQFGPIGGLATDAAGNVYVVDSMHNRIEKFDPNGNFITAWGHYGTELGEFRFFSSQKPDQPPGGGIAITGTYVYVVDSGNDRVERFNLEGSEAMQWGSYGGGPGQFSYPRGIAANATEVLVADDDNHRIEKFDPNGNFQASAGSDGSGPGQFGFPYGVTLDAAGNSYVADDINHRIVKLTPELNFAAEWGGFGFGPGQLAFPRALASGPAGNTFVADTANDRIQVFDPEGHYLRTLGASAHDLSVLTAPRGLATDPAGGLLVSDTVSNRIELYSPGTNVFSAAWSTAVGRNAGFNGTEGIAVDPRGSVYVADPSDERIVHLWGDSTFLSELGGPADIGGAQLRGAGSVAVAAPSGDLYVADTNHNRVLVYDPKGSLLAKWGHGGGDGSPGSGAGEFERPTSVAVGPQGNVYVADAGNSRVEVFAANGRFAGKWGLRGAQLGELSQPTAIAIDCAGSVYVADTNNNRVERFDPYSPTPGACLAPGAWPPPLDVAPVLHVSLLRRAGVLTKRALALAVSCERGCKVLVSALLSPRGRRGGVKLIAATHALAPALIAQVRVRVGPAGLRRLRRALGRHSQMTAQVSVLAAGPTGRRTVVKRVYVVSR